MLSISFTSNKHAWIVTWQMSQTNQSKTIRWKRKQDLSDYIDIVLERGTMNVSPPSWLVKLPRLFTCSRNTDNAVNSVHSCVKHCIRVINDVIYSVNMCQESSRECSCVSLASSHCSVFRYCIRTSNITVWTSAARSSAFYTSTTLVCNCNVSSLINCAIIHEIFCTSKRKLFRTTNDGHWIGSQSHQ